LPYPALQLNWNIYFHRTILNKCLTLYLDLAVIKKYSSITIHGALTGTAHALVVYVTHSFAKTDSNNTAFNFNPSKGDGANGKIQ
jgi:hypothetical protein